MIRCTKCNAKIPANDVGDELAELGCAYGIDLKGKSFILCRKCTLKMIEE